MRLSSYTKLYYRDYPSELEVNIRSLGERLAARRCNAVFAPSAVHANAFAADIHRKVQVTESSFWNESDVYDDSVYQTRLVEKKYDNFSNACMEAMCFESVVIGTDGTSYEQLIDDRKSGLLCVPGDAASLLHKMNVAASMSDQQKAEMGKLARRRIDLDQKADKIYADFDVFTPDCPLEEVDAVVVTSITFFYEIEKILSTKLDCPIISLEDILYPV